MANMSTVERTWPKPSEIPALFGDRPDDPVLHYDRFNLEEVRAQVRDIGFGIVRGLVPESRIQRIRSFWIDTFSNIKPAGRVTWTPFMGQVNNIGFTSDSFQHLYRAVDFLWNEPINADTRDTCLRVHALRNLLLDQDPYFGMRFTDARSGIFVTASYYPGGSGFMAMHDDGVSPNKPLLHSLVPITFKGRDYKEGGMLVVNRKGQNVDVDAQLQPGDVVFYDGSLKHEVVPVVPLPGKTLGRIQIFPIPTVFSNLESNKFVIARIPLVKFLDAKWYWLKDQLRIKLGRHPAIR
jgi:hypothetical protein